MSWQVGVGLLVLGTLLGYVGRQFLSVQFKPEFDIADITSFVFTAVVALLLQNYWTKKFTINQSAKTLLVDNVKEVLVAARELRKIARASYEQQRAGPQDFNLVTSEFKTLGSLITMLEDAVGIFLEDRCQLKLKLSRGTFIAYKRALTSRSQLSPYTEI